jgi:penicillin-binding protein 1B
VRHLLKRAAFVLQTHRLLFASAALVCMASAVSALACYLHFSHLIDAGLPGLALHRGAAIYTAPRRVAVGQTVSAGELVRYLKFTGYGESVGDNARGRLRFSPSVMEVRPGPDSWFRSQNALRIEFRAGRISRITALDTGASTPSAELEPELLTNLGDAAREKRRFVSFSELPSHLVDAVLAAEDKRFFDHPGFDPVRVLGAARVDLTHASKAQGASTLTMQLARSFFLDTRREWRRKLSETFIALLLEERFTKKQIFEMYANEIYLGNRGSFAVHGFAAAARSYFGKDVRECSLAEACFLAGIIRAPNRWSSPELDPGRAPAARDRVLDLLLGSGRISPEAAAQARAAPLNFVSRNLEAGPAPYFVDLVRDRALQRFGGDGAPAQGCRIYTGLDNGVQAAANEAVDAGLRSIEGRLARRRNASQRRAGALPPVQAALVAMDVRTGEVRALVGGRDYAQSQLNRALAERQPGSVFKPFVYATAFNTALDGSALTLTPGTLVDDEPTSFETDRGIYTPANYGEDYYGDVTLRTALTRSLNVATVKVAEMAGYDRVAEFARLLVPGMRIQPTPALALGAYEMTPLQVASAYTVFARGGKWIEPRLLRRIDGSDGAVIDECAPQERRVLDPRVAFMVTSILEDVLNHGTGGSVRRLGFLAPAAGKTGTSHDGWFAGFTSDLLCVVWVGYDDNRELHLSGGESAAIIWAEFMKRAVGLPGYSAPHSFNPPEGIAATMIDPATGELAADCPDSRLEYYVSGTQPTTTCSLHRGLRLAGLLPISWVSSLARHESTAREPVQAAAVPALTVPASGAASQDEQAVDTRQIAQGVQTDALEAKPKEGVFRRFLGLFHKPKTEPARSP